MKSKKRILIVTAIMAVIVLFLIIVVIVAATSRTKKVESSVETQIASGSVSVEPGKSSDHSADVAEENLAPVSNSDDSAVVQSTPVTIVVPEVVEETTLPATGPLNLLPLALVLGSLTTFLGSNLLLRRA